MPVKSKTLHKGFQNKIEILERTRLSFERSFHQNIVSSSEIIQAYAGLYLDLFTEFEGLIENLFVGILSGTISHNNALVSRKVKITPVSELLPVLLGPQKTYMDWLPYTTRTIPRANLFFLSGNPFTFLGENEKNKLHNFHKIRNAIAHKSTKAMNDFNSLVSGLTLLPVEKTPQGFLRNIPNRSAGLTQFEIISNELLAISYKLCN
jgi:hypothetical protein